VYISVSTKCLVKAPVEDAQPSHTVDINIIHCVKDSNVHHAMWAHIPGNLKMVGRQAEAVELKSTSPSHRIIFSILVKRLTTLL
jgi:hypothetical protein